MSARPVGSPANCPGAVAVGGIDSDFRAVAADQLRPARPTSWAPRRELPQETNNGTKLTGGSGTSAATAIVSATFALIKAHIPRLHERANCSRARSTTSTTARTSSASASTTSSGTARSCPYFAMTFTARRESAQPDLRRMAEARSARRRQLRTASGSPSPPVHDVRHASTPVRRRSGAERRPVTASRPGAKKRRLGLVERRGDRHRRGRWSWCSAASSCCSSMPAAGAERGADEPATEPAPSDTGSRGTWSGCCTTAAGCAAPSRSCTSSRRTCSSPTFYERTRGGLPAMQHEVDGLVQPQHRELRRVRRHPAAPTTRARCGCSSRASGTT